MGGRAGGAGGGGGRGGRAGAGGAGGGGGVGESREDGSYTDRPMLKPGTSEQRAEIAWPGVSQLTMLVKSASGWQPHSLFILYLFIAHTIPEFCFVLFFTDTHKIPELCV